MFFEKMFNDMLALTASDTMNRCEKIKQYHFKRNGPRPDFKI